MISDRCKFIFIHIPKTGGSSVSYALKAYANENVHVANSRVGRGKGVAVTDSKGRNVKHLHLYGLLRMNPEYNNYFSFTIVRNPYDRTMSYFFWNYANKEFDRKKFINFVKRCDDFQFRYVTEPKTGKLLVKRILKFENLNSEIKRLPVPITGIPHLNQSHNSRGNFYDQELKDLVYEKFKKDFELFGYKK